MKDKNKEQEERLECSKSLGDLNRSCSMRSPLNTVYQGLFFLHVIYVPISLGLQDVYHPDSSEKWKGCGENLSSIISWDLFFFGSFSSLRVGVEGQSRGK